MSTTIIETVFVLVLTGAQYTSLEQCEAQAKQTGSQCVELKAHTTIRTPTR